MHFWHIIGWKRIKYVFEFLGFSKIWCVLLAVALLLATQYQHKKQTIKLKEQQQKYRNNTTK